MNFEEFYKDVKVEPETEKIRLKGVCNSVWNAAIDEAVKVTQHDYQGCDDQYTQDGIDLVLRLKELKQ